MELGDLECGYGSWATSNVHAFLAGFPLELIAQTGATLMEQLKQYQVESIRCSFVPFCYLVLHLMRFPEVPPIDYSELDNVPPGGQDISETFCWIWVCWSHLQLTYYFGEFDIAGKIVMPFWKLSAIDTSYIMTSYQIFFSGLTACAMAKKTGNQKYLQRAEKATQEMQKIMRTQGLNNLHRYLLMQAKFSACSSTKKNHIKSPFD
jgi:hypothetical protein